MNRPENLVGDNDTRGTCLLNVTSAAQCVADQPNRDYLAATMTRRDDILGVDLFEVFPSNPDAERNGEADLAASLARVLDTEKRERMPVVRYDVRNPEGIFEERWWQATNTPVFDEDSRLTLILHQAKDVTQRIRARRASREHSRSEHH